MPEDYNYLYKLVMVGDAGVGKTNISTRFVSNIFSTNSKPTIGVNFYSLMINHDDKRCLIKYSAI